MEKSRDGLKLKRVILLRSLAEKGLSVGAIKEILSPMAGMTEEQKEAYAAEILKKLESGEINLLGK